MLTNSWRIFFRVKQNPNSEIELKLVERVWPGSESLIGKIVSSSQELGFVDSLTSWNMLTHAHSDFSPADLSGSHQFLKMQIMTSLIVFLGY